MEVFFWNQLGTVGLRAARFYLGKSQELHHSSSELMVTSFLAEFAARLSEVEGTKTEALGRGHSSRQDQQTDPLFRGNVLGTNYSSCSTFLLPGNISFLALLSRTRGSL